MGFTRYFEYEATPLTSKPQWNQLRGFAKLAVKQVPGVRLVASSERLLQVVADPGCESFEIYRNGIDAFTEHRTGFCKTGRLPYDSVVLALLMAANRVGLVNGASCDGDVQDDRAGLELYYNLCDAFRMIYERDWWEALPPKKSK